MAKWKEFASIFGVELNENFRIKYGGKTHDNIYRFTEKGLQWKTINGWYSCCADDIEDLLIGETEVIKILWKPKKGDAYFSYKPISDSACLHFSWDCTEEDLNLWKIGNCFKTQEEAETKGKEIMKAILKEYIQA